jgi:protein gp37
VFVCDLADPFTRGLPGEPGEWLTPYLPAMAASPHVWILCTKHPEWMAYYFNLHELPKNFWLLTTVTSVATLHRLNILRWIKGASVLGVSLEPLLGPLELPYMGRVISVPDDSFEPLGWAVLGFASGPRAAPGHPDWARSVRDQCVASGVPFFFKQWGEWVPKASFANFAEWDRARAHALVLPDGSFTSVAGRDEPDPELGLTCADLDGNDYAASMALVGKRAAGRLLDGRDWMQMPEVRRV